MRKMVGDSDQYSAYTVQHTRVCGDGCVLTRAYTHVDSYKPLVL